MKLMVSLPRMSCRDIFSPLGKPADGAIYFSFRNFFFFTFDQSYLRSTGPIFTIFFHQMEGI